MKRWKINHTKREVLVLSNATTAEYDQAGICADNHGYDLVTVMVPIIKAKGQCNCHTNAQMGVCQCL